ncbi:hypothetical protein TELCIR_05787 [Teladorsagia circumcincta]|uniref:Uncharacterized protein n=1 Tax=Teladorsagia circumcincta TaxID=45464 RepID=A0A2G9URG1_TELCI|nr:hypothetical protein TELCIR_05787 [Teladorsagia circumcincta]
MEGRYFKRKAILNTISRSFSLLYTLHVTMSPYWLTNAAGIVKEGNQAKYGLYEAAEVFRGIAFKLWCLTNTGLASAQILCSFARGDYRRNWTNRL